MHYPFEGAKDEAEEMRKPTLQAQKLVEKAAKKTRTENSSKLRRRGERRYMSLRCGSSLTLQDEQNSRAMQRFQRKKRVTCRVSREWQMKMEIRAELDCHSFVEARRKAKMNVVRSKHPQISCPVHRRLRVSLYVWRENISSIDSSTHDNTLQTAVTLFR